MVLVISGGSLCDCHRLVGDAMSDEQTMKDHIEDLMLEVAELRKKYQQSEYMMRQWRRAAVAAFEMTGGCITGCKGVCLCTCGFEHYRAAIAQQERIENKK